MKEQDTIAAIATTSIQGGISIIRVSGEESFDIVSKLFQSKKRMIDLKSEKSHTIHYGFIVDGQEIVDEVLVSIMKSPRSYTKEDVVEIHCHGGAMASKRVLEVVCKQGARIAEPGEFTKRAFLNGRIDLSQAEAVIDIIQSKNEYALKSSVSQLRGNIKQKVKEIRENLLHDIAWIEAALDDPEHISLEHFSEELEVKCNEMKKEVELLINSYENGRRIKEGVRTAIIGKPNAGKSSLLNILLGQERAIVTNVPGTTRDTLEEECQIGNVTLQLIDTAGIHKTEDTVEKIGVERALQEIEQADFLIHVIDSSEDLSREDEKIFEETNNNIGVILLNKSDLENRITISDIKNQTDKKVISFSTMNKEGLKDLEQYISKCFYQEKLHFNDEIYITSLRQKEALVEANNSISHVLSGIKEGMSEDFLSIDLTDIYESLGKIIGETLEDDIIDKIFKDFCMGK